MILPTKHISQENSLLGVSGTLLQNLTRPMTVSELWEQLRTKENVGTFQRYVSGLDLLFILGVITFDGVNLRRTKNAS